MDARPVIDEAELKGMHAAQGLGWAGLGWGALTKHYTRTGLEEHESGGPQLTRLRLSDCAATSSIRAELAADM